MNARIAAILKDRISQFTYVDRIAGMVRTAQMERAGQVVKLPVAIDVDDDLACDASTLRDMVPDERYACMVYFEDRGFQRITSRTRGTSFRSSIRMVCWVNTAKFGGDPMAGERIMQQFLAEVHQPGPVNTDTLVGLRTTAETSPERGGGLFGAYTYPESASQYLLWPFDAFAIDIAAEYRLRPGCEDEPVPGDDTCWTPPTTKRRRNPSEFTCEELQDPETGLTADQLGAECLDCEGGGGGGTVTITGTDGLTELPPVDCGDTYPLPDTHIFFQDNVGQPGGVLLGLGTVVEETDGHLYPDIVVPSRFVKNTAGNNANTFRATLEDLVNDTLPIAQDGFWSLKDTDGNELNTGSIPSNASDDITAPDATVTRDGLPFGTVLSGGTIDVPSDCPPCDPLIDVRLNGGRAFEQIDLECGLNDYDIIVTREDGTPVGEWDPADERIEVRPGQVQLQDSAANSIGSVVNIEPESLGNLITAPDATVQLKDSAGNNIGTPDSYRSDTSNNKTAPDGTVQRQNTAGTNIGSPIAVRSNQTGLVITAPDATIQRKDSAGNIIGSPLPALSNITTDITCPDGTLNVRNLNGTTLGSQAVRSNATANYDAPIPLKFAWAAGDADTFTWTVTDDEAGTYGTYTQTGTNGTVTCSKNGGAYAAVSGSISLAVGDTITVRRTTTTNAGSIKWAP